VAHGHHQSQFQQQQLTAAAEPTAHGKLLLLVQLPEVLHVCVLTHW
jgi:hypothetical protein